MPAEQNRSGGGGDRPGSKRDAARRRIAERQAAEAAERARAQRRRRNLIGGVAAAAVLVIALVVVVAVQSRRTTTSATAAVPAHTVAGGTVIEVTAADVAGGSSAASSGASGKPVVVNLYEDLQCPNCKAFEAQSGGTLATLLAQGTVVLHYHPMAFLDSSANGNFSTRALNAAAAVLDAAGPGAFQKFHDLVYANQTPEEGPGMTDDRLVAYATQAGATGPAVAQAIDGGTYDDWTRKVTDQASKDGVTGTPTVIIGGKTLTDLSPAGVTAAVSAAAQG